MIIYLLYINYIYLFNLFRCLHIFRLRANVEKHFCFLDRDGAKVIENLSEGGRVLYTVLTTFL